MCKHLQSIKSNDLGTDRGRLLMYIINSSGPRILPCGTSDVAGSREDDTPSIVVS